MDKLVGFVPSFHDGVFYFALVGCMAAAFKHYFSAPKVLKELSPVAFDANGKLHPAAQWWGGYGFGIMNAGFGAVGAFAAFKSSADVKQAFLLGTSVLFALFAASWATQGAITEKKDVNKHALKMSLFAALFAAGFVSSLRA